MATTEADNTEIARRVSVEAWGEGNFAVIDEYFADDFVGHNPATGETRGPGEYKEQITTAFPDLDATVEDQIADGNKVVQRIRATGTHEGELMGVEPTGKTVEVSGIVIGWIDDGTVAEEWAQIDMLGLMQQLGVVDPPGE